MQRKATAFRRGAKSGSPKPPPPPDPNDAAAVAAFAKFYNSSFEQLKSDEDDSILTTKVVNNDPFVVGKPSGLDWIPVRIESNETVSSFLEEFGVIYGPTPCDRDGINPYLGVSQLLHGKFGREPEEGQIFEKALKDIKRCHVNMKLNQGYKLKEFLPLDLHYQEISDIADALIDSLPVKKPERPLLAEASDVNLNPGPSAGSDVNGGGDAGHVNEADDWEIISNQITKTLLETTTKLSSMMSEQDSAEPTEETKTEDVQEPKGDEPEVFFPPWMRKKKHHYPRRQYRESQLPAEGDTETYSHGRPGIPHQNKGNRTKTNEAPNPATARMPPPGYANYHEVSRRFVLPNRPPPGFGGNGNKKNRSYAAGGRPPPGFQENGTASSSRWRETPYPPESGPDSSNWRA